MTLAEALTELENGYPSVGVAVRPNRLGGMRITPICKTGWGYVFAPVDALVRYYPDGSTRLLTTNDTQLSIILSDFQHNDWEIVWEHDV